MSTTVTVATAHLDPCINKGVNSLHTFLCKWAKYAHSQWSMAEIHVQHRQLSKP